MFKKLLGGNKSTNSASHLDGQKLFVLGMAHAVQYDSEKALEYYAKSIEICPNPAPYINRANILCKRIRYHEALQDLRAAQRLDRAQSEEFTGVLRREIALAEALTHMYRSGMREKLLNDLEENGDDFVVGKIISASFGISHVAWEHGAVPKLAEFHFYNELDNVKKFDRPNLYPDIEAYLEDYPAEFIEQEVSSCPDIEAYSKAEQIMHSFLCIYAERTMRQLRNLMIYRLHERILDDQYGFSDLTTNNPAITKAAYKFKTGKEYVEGDESF